MADNIESLKQELRQLQTSHATGSLPTAQYEQSRSPLERRLVDLILQDSSATGPSMRLWFILAGLIVVMAAAGYWWTSSSKLPGSDAETANTNPHDNSDAQDHAGHADQMSAMADRLAARLKEQPQNADGWAMLGRSYSVLGRHPQALQAYERAVALRKDDPELLADYADALALRNNSRLAGEPMKWVERALKIDPHNIKALSLAGTHAFDRKDYASAVKYWQQVVEFGTADHPLVQQVGPGLAQAREMAGLPIAAKKPETQRLATATGASVSGTVTLSASLSKQVSPEDTVFIFARAAEGSRMPLAIVRKQVRDLPFQFSLDESMAMSPAGRLSGASKIIVGARVSKTGDALPQPGDLTGQIGPVKLGASGLKLDISELVKP